MNVEELASKLVGYHTEAPAGDEEQCAMYLLDYVRSLDFKDVEVDVHNFAPNRANLVVRIGARLPPGLILSGHIDTVNAGDPKLWNVTSPFEPKITEGKLFGRGAADMKGGVSALAKSLESIQGKKLKRKVTFVATAGEEAGCYGLRQLIGAKKISSNDGLYCIVGEPTEMKPVRKHKGVTRFHVHFTGKSAHSSHPEQGVNAIEHASKFISELVVFRQKLAEDVDSELGATLLPVTFEQGGIRGRFNVIPETCELVIVCRRLPRHTSGYLKHELQAIIERLGLENSDFKAHIEVQYEANSLDTSKESPIVSVAEKYTGWRSTIASFGTEAAYYQEMGIPSIVLGPGSIEQAHTPDEFISLEEMRRAVNVYGSLIQEICL